MNIAVIGKGVIGKGLGELLLKYHAVTFYGRGDKKEIQGAKLVLLAVKPKDLAAVAKEIYHSLTKEMIIVSTLAATPKEVLKTYFPKNCIVQMMPSVSNFYGKGVVGFVDDSELLKEKKNEVEQVFSCLGRVVWVEKNAFDALTALAGSGPAFAFILIESMIDAGIFMGLSKNLSKEIVLEMLLGAVETVKQSEKSLSELKWQVTSPGGCTASGVKMMEDEAVRSGVINTFLATLETLLSKKD